jgi:hypothetical protein
MEAQISLNLRDTRRRSQISLKVSVLRVLTRSSAGSSTSRMVLMCDATNLSTFQSVETHVWVAKLLWIPESKTRTDDMWCRVRILAGSDLSLVLNMIKGLSSNPAHCLASGDTVSVNSRLNCAVYYTRRRVFRSLWCNILCRQMSSQMSSGNTMRFCLNLLNSVPAPRC